MAALLYISVGSLFISLCVYIHGMVADMEAEMSNLTFLSNFDATTRWSIVVKEINFHNEIIAYAKNLTVKF